MEKLRAARICVVTPGDDRTRVWERRRANKKCSSPGGDEGKRKILIYWWGRTLPTVGVVNPALETRRTAGKKSTAPRNRSGAGLQTQYPQARDPTGMTLASYLAWVPSGPVTRRLMTVRLLPPSSLRTDQKGGNHCRQNNNGVAKIYHKQKNLSNSITLRKKMRKSWQLKRN